MMLYIWQQEVGPFLDVAESKNYLICTFWVYVIGTSTVRLPFGASLIIQFLSGSTSPPPRKERERDGMFLTCDDTTLSSPTRQLLDKCSQNSPRDCPSRSNDPFAFTRVRFYPWSGRQQFLSAIIRFLASHKFSAVISSRYIVSRNLIDLHFCSHHEWRETCETT